MYEAQCDFNHLGTYSVWLLSQPEVQQQIDCFGNKASPYFFSGPSRYGNISQTKEVNCPKTSLEAICDGNFSLEPQSLCSLAAIVEVISI